MLARRRSDDGIGLMVMEKRDPEGLRTVMSQSGLLVRERD